MASWNAVTSGPPATGGDTPDWLQNTDTDINAAAGSSISGDVEKLALEEPAPGKTKTSSPADKKAMSPYRAVCLSVVSCLLLVLFIVCAYFQYNDPDSAQWTIFYALHATVAAVALIYYHCCFPLKLLYFLCFAMSVWSIVLISITSVNVKNGRNDASLSSDDFQQICYELGGSTLTLLSAVYHASVAKCCFNKEGNKSE